jgi:hypothetical protein
MEDLNYEHPFPRISGHYRVSDIMEVDITEFRVYTCAYVRSFALLWISKLECLRSVLKEPI